MGENPFGGRYRMKERIGVGGMAEVYLAVATGAAGFEREVVVKSLLPAIAADPRLAASFLDEARLLARLSHPHIAQVLDLGEGPEGTYLVMEYVSGRDLRALMEKLARPLDPGLAALVVRDVAEALEHGFQAVGERGVPLKLIHRDVSLSNVMVSMAGVVKLVDFGLAKALTDYRREATAAGMVKGKLSYIAPEILRGQPADHRSDVFSTGVVLFELVTGRKLYKPTADIVLVLEDRERTAPAPSSVVPGIPKEIDAIVAKALARDPGRRFARAEEMAAALDEVVHQRRTRPAQLAALMATLFEPKRMHATQEMAPLEAHDTMERPALGEDEHPSTVVDRVDPRIAALGTDATGAAPMPSRRPRLPGVNVPPTGRNPVIEGPDTAPTPVAAYRREEPPAPAPDEAVLRRSRAPTPAVGPPPVAPVASKPWMVLATIGGLVLLAAAAVLLVFK
jgi:eukaryotic-like serine/threonine-protein kinase